MHIFTHEQSICDIDNVPLFQVLKMGKLSVAFILVIISMGITEMVGQQKKTRLQYGYLIDPIEEVVLIRSTSKHIFKAKRLFLHQREVEELMFNITLIEGSLGEVSHSINISVSNCKGRLTHLCKIKMCRYHFGGRYRYRYRYPIFLRPIPIPIPIPNSFLDRYRYRYRYQRNNRYRYRYLPILRYFRKFS